MNELPQKYHGNWKVSQTKSLSYIKTLDFWKPEKVEGINIELEKSKKLEIELSSDKMIMMIEGEVFQTIEINNSEILDDKIIIETTDPRKNKKVTFEILKSKDADLKFILSKRQDIMNEYIWEKK